MRCSADGTVVLLQGAQAPPERSALICARVLLGSRQLTQLMCCGRVLRRRANRAQRRAKKVAVPAAPPGAAGFGALASEKRDGRTASPAPPTTPPSPPPAATPPTPAGTPNQDSGIFGGVKSFFDEANAIGKAQAITLNSKLEDAGVLSPVAAGDGDSKAASVDSADAMQSTSSTDAGVTALPADNTLTTKGQAKGRKGNNKKGNQRKKKSKA